MFRKLLDTWLNLDKTPKTIFYDSPQKIVPSLPKEGFNHKDVLMAFLPTKLVIFTTWFT